MPHYLEDKEIIMLLDLAGRLGIYAEVCLALNTGLRRGELRMLRWDQVDLSRRILKIPAGKSKRPGIVPLNTEAQKVLEQQRAVSGRLDYVFPGWRSKRVGLKNAPRGMNWWCSAMEQFCRAIPAFGRLPKGSTGRGWHMLRHTFASRLVQKGVSIYKVSRWLRHSSVQTTQIYAHLAEGWDEDIEKVSGKIGDIP
jgi:integrase